MHILEYMIEYIYVSNKWYLKLTSECGVTANIPGLGPGDSGFESRHSDKL